MKGAFDMTLEELARDIVSGLITADKSPMPDDVDFVLEQLRFAINDKLEEVAEALESGTTAQTPAGLVRAMKEH
jgi:hypothetical protein